MRIAICTDTFLPQVNGVVRSIITTANELASGDHEVIILTMDVSKVARLLPHKNNDLSPLVKVYPLPSLALPGFPEIQARVPTFIKPYRILKAFKPDVMHCHTIFSLAWEAMILSKILRVRFVATHHGFLADYLDNFRLNYELPKHIVRRIISFYFNQCDTVITPAQALANELIEHGLKKPIYIVSNPLDLVMFNTQLGKQHLKSRHAVSKLTFVHVGRLVTQKSVDQLIKVFAKLIRTGADAELWIIGDGKERAKLEALTEVLNLSNNVKFLGLLHGNQLVECVASCDVFVSTSKTEVQALVFLEAMSLGLPCIGVVAGGVPEFVHHQVNGLLVKADDEDGCAAAMNYLYNNRNLILEYGEAARKTVKEFDSRTVIKKIVGVYSGKGSQ